MKAWLEWMNEKDLHPNADLKKEKKGNATTGTGSLMGPGGLVVIGCSCCWKFIVVVPAHEAMRSQKQLQTKTIKRKGTRLLWKDMFQHQQKHRPWHRAHHLDQYDVVRDHQSFFWWHDPGRQTAWACREMRMQTLLPDSPRVRPTLSCLLSWEKILSVANKRGNWAGSSILVPLAL